MSLLPHVRKALLWLVALTVMPTITQDALAQSTPELMMPNDIVGPLPSAQEVSAASFSPNGGFVLAFTSSNTYSEGNSSYGVWILDAVSGKVVRLAECVDAVLFCPDGHSIGTKARKKGVLIFQKWKIPSGELAEGKTEEEIKTLFVTEGMKVTGLIKPAPVRHDGELVLQAVEKELCILDNKSQRVVCKVKLYGSVGFSGSPEWLIVSPEGAYDGSANARELIQFKSGDCTMLAWRFGDAYRPGLLGALFRGDEIRVSWADSIVQFPTGLTAGVDELVSGSRRLKLHGLYVFCRNGCYITYGVIGFGILISMWIARRPFRLQYFAMILVCAALAAVGSSGFWYGLYRFQSTQHVVPSLIEHANKLNTETERRNREFKHFLRDPLPLLPVPDEAFRNKIEVEGTYAIVAGVVVLVLGLGIWIVSLRRAAISRGEAAEPSAAPDPAGM